MRDTIDRASADMDWRALYSEASLAISRLYQACCAQEDRIKILELQLRNEARLTVPKPDTPYVVYLPPTPGAEPYQF